MTRGNERQGYCLLSLPNSGSTWFAKCLAEQLRVPYFMEYFNPLRNFARYGELSRGFGCELLSCSRWIADSPGDDVLDEVWERTWCLDGFQFTKEVFSATKAAWFARRFHTAILISEECLVFPPTRLRVYSFYEHAICQATANAPEHVSDRSRFAFRHLRERLLADAQESGIPVIQYRDLLIGTKDSIAESIARTGWPIDAAACAAECVRTRKLPVGREEVLIGHNAAV